jgi:hypothetical protein
MMTKKHVGQGVYTCLARAVYAIQMAIVRPLRDNERRYEVQKAKPYTLGDFTILCEPGAATRASVSCVAEALGLINELHPRFFRRIRHDLKRFYIRRGAGAQYWSRLRLCVLEANRVSQGQAHEIALDIIHEATHARLLSAGIPWVPELFERVERRCVNAEILFCKRLSERGYSVGERILWYERRLESPIYTRKAIHAWRLRDRRAREADGLD